MKFRNRVARWFNREYAHYMGYFWLPCPRCGTEFGGHEWSRCSIPYGELSGRMVCPWCSQELIEARKCW